MPHPLGPMIPTKEEGLKYTDTLSRICFFLLRGLVLMRGLAVLMRSLVVSMRGLVVLMRGLVVLMRGLVVLMKVITKF